MTKAELVDLVLIRVNSGRLTQDTKVRREDISYYLPFAVNYSVLKNYWLHRKEEGESGVDGQFLATYENVPVLFNSDRGLKYIDMPAKAMPLPKNRGLDMISPMQGDMQFIEATLSQRKHNSHVIKHMTDMTLYWQEGQKVYFQQLSDLTDKVLLHMVVAAQDLEDGDEVPIPAGSEIEVLQLLVELCTGQRQLPGDYRNDNNGDLK